MALFQQLHAPTKSFIETSHGPIHTFNTISSLRLTIIMYHWSDSNITVALVKIPNTIKTIFIDFELAFDKLQ